MSYYFYDICHHIALYGNFSAIPDIMLIKRMRNYFPQGLKGSLSIISGGFDFHTDF